MNAESCPCQSGQPYAMCCGPLHAGGIAPTAEVLMRSRYCAFVKKNLPYLVRTSHPAIRNKLRPKDVHAAFALGWCGLEIVATSGGGPDDQEGVVHFRASKQGGIHDETSRFTRIAGEWVYRDEHGKIPAG